MMGTGATMATPDIHAQEFHESTEAKLRVYQDYLKEWLPVFPSRLEQ